MGKMENMCFEPKSFAVEMTLPDGKTDFVNTRLMTRQTYTLEGIKGDMNTEGGNIKFVETDGIDFAPTTVKLPTGEYQPFLFTVKNLTVKGEGASLKPGFSMGGDFTVPSYRTGLPRPQEPRHVHGLRSGGRFASSASVGRPGGTLQ